MEMVNVALDKQLIDAVNEQLLEIGITLSEYLEMNFVKKEQGTRSIEELFEGCDDDYRGETYDFGEPCGKEIW